MLLMSETNPCPCGSGLSLNACCKPLIDGTAKAPTAEALMRSRYTAYASADVGYITRTHDPDTLDQHDEEQARELEQPSRQTQMVLSHGTSGKAEKGPVRRQGPRVGRNDPCPCGSGKKYKKCCGAASAEAGAA